MEKKEYLNEENYQRAKKKITRISLIILIVGLAIGIALIVTGVIMQNNTKKANEEKREAAYKESQRQIDEAEKRIAAIDDELSALSSQISTKQRECDSMNMTDPNWFSTQNSCQNEVMSLRAKQGKLEVEKSGLENDDFTVFYSPISSSKYLIFYYLGGSVIVFACVVAGVFYLIAKRREIAAFTIQQTMPLAQETIEKMAPTIGNAAGEIAKGITSGIKEGKKDKE